jgi:hypothetical protein
MVQRLERSITDSFAVPDVARPATFALPLSRLKSEI